MMEKNAKIYVAGHRGMVGSAIVRELQRQGYTNIITRTHKELDLTRQDAVEEFFAQEKPEYVFLAAAKVGGIVANQEALADFMYDNMTLEMNAIHSAWKNGCKKLEFLGSSCIYPRMAPQPMQESCLLTSELEKTNEAYALAKISGLKYCEFLNRQYGTDYISVMPTNLYGPNDNYHPTHSHVVPALIRRFHEAKEQGLPSVTCWGDGSPLREFLYVDDLANLCVFLMNNYSGNETVNAGTGKELTIKELTELVDINRGTFYLHYDDIYDMLHKVEDEMFREFNEIMEQEPLGTPTLSSDGLLLEFFRFLDRHRDLARVMIGPHGDLTFVNRLKDQIKKRTLRFLESAQSDANYEYLCSFIITGCVGVVETWLKEVTPQSPEEMAGILGTMLMRQLTFVPEPA